MFVRQIISLLQLFFFFCFSSGLSIDDSDTESVCEAAGEVVKGEFNYYEGIRPGGTVGMFVAPYYWWNAGEVFGGWIDYYTFCDHSNHTLEELIYDGMYHQAGRDYNYIPSNQSYTEGNDDQGVWGMALLEAVERNFTNPPSHSWLSMTQAIYNTMNEKWDTEHCQGGLRWQMFAWNSGYNYKNIIANGCLFHISARLARYTGLERYVTTAEKVWDWVIGVGFVVEGDNQTTTVYDGAEINDNCTDIQKLEWSYNYGILMAGAAYLYNHTGDDSWLQKVDSLVDSSSYFFNGTIMYEATCAKSGTCNNDQRTFRALFARCLGLTMMMAPSTREKIQPWLTDSADAAARSCSGGTDGITCGENWSVDGWDGVYGLGEQMSSLEVMLGSIVTRFPAPYNASNGGSSKSDVNAGNNTQILKNLNKLDIKTKDKVGAAILTAVVLAVILSGSIFLLF